jgi:cyclophilin family peptidyl-prolyl cis-trans isomerase
MKNNELLKLAAVLVSCTGVLVISALAVFGIVPLKINLFQPKSPTESQNLVFQEGKAVAPVITVGPFDLHRRYRSMEGPFADINIRIGDLVAGKQAVIPEGSIKFTEHLGGQMPSMRGGPGSADSMSTLPNTSHGRKLLWLKGFKLDVLDEAGNVLPNSEFLCHVNIDIDVNKRNELFPDGARCTNGRLLTLTQGQAEVAFPAGFAYPLASDEIWRFVFQAANRTTDAHRRIKQRLTVYLLPDEELVQPVTALNYFNPSVEVVVDKNSPQVTAQEKSLCPLCNPTGRGVVPPNAVTSSVSSDRFGRKTTVHWVVPPGTRTWSSTLYNSEVGRDKPRIVHAVWSHVHPCCTEFSFVRVTETKRSPLWLVTCGTDTGNGERIQHIDYISSSKGIVVPANSVYQTVIAYNNTTGHPIDSMATMGAFFEDNDFARPEWVYQKDMGQFCGINQQAPAKRDRGPTMASHQPASPPQAITAETGVRSYPLFNEDKDGPLLKQARTVRIKTSSGNLAIVIEPKWAPRTATQMARLFEKHAFDGTQICAYHPGYLLQVALAEDKVAGQKPIKESVKSLIRRIPLEVDAQFSKEIYHKAGMLSMARQDNDPLDNSSSFSILLGDEPHLDNKYTIFGKLSDDAETKATLAKLIVDWPTHPFIVKTLTL